MMEAHEQLPKLKTDLGRQYYGPACADTAAPVAIRHAEETFKKRIEELKKKEEKGEGSLVDNLAYYDAQSAAAELYVDAIKYAIELVELSIGAIVAAVAIGLFFLLAAGFDHAAEEDPS